MSNPCALKRETDVNGLGAGVWNLGSGGDPFGGPAREAIAIFDRLPLLAEASVSFYEAHMSPSEASRSCFRTRR